MTVPALIQIADSNSLHKDRLHRALGPCHAVDNNLLARLPPDTNPSGVYHRAKVNHKTYHSTRYTRKGNASSNVVKTQSGNHLILECFVALDNGSLLAAGHSLSSTALPHANLHQFHVPTDVTLSCAEIFSHFHYVDPSQYGPLLLTSCNNLLSRCIVHEISETLWLISDFIEDFEHD